MTGATGGSLRGAPRSPRATYRLRAVVECRKCHRWIDGWIDFGARNEVVDSGGYVIFGAGPHCNDCLREGPPAVVVRVAPAANAKED